MQAEGGNKSPSAVTGWATVTAGYSSESDTVANTSILKPQCSVGRLTRYGAVHLLQISVHGPLDETVTVASR